MIQENHVPGTSVADWDSDQIFYANHFIVFWLFFVITGPPTHTVKEVAVLYCSLASVVVCRL